MTTLSMPKPRIDNNERNVRLPQQNAPSGADPFSDLNTGQVNDRMRNLARVLAEGTVVENRREFGAFPTDPGELSFVMLATNPTTGSCGSCSGAC
jgi:hypothetical protein